MRRLVKFIVVLALLWCGWWWAGTALIERGVANWLVGQRTQGLHAEIGSTSVSGFPLGFDTTLKAVDLGDPSSALSLQAEQLELSTPAYWPGQLLVKLPESPITLTGPDLTLYIRAQDGQAAIRLNPNSRLDLDHLTAKSGPWQLNTPQGNLVSAKTLDVQLTQDNTQSAKYDFTASAEALAPGDLIRQPLQLPPDWPLSFERLMAKGELEFDRPLDRFAADTLPQLRAFKLSDLRLTWGTVDITGESTLRIDSAGVPEGDISLALRNWRQVVEFAVQSGALAAQDRPQIELFLTALASRGGAPETLDLALEFRGGMMSLSGIPLGPAPRLILR